MIKNLDGGIFELLPLPTRSGSDRSSVANDDPSPPSQSTSTSSSALSKLAVFRVLPLILFALIAGVSLFMLVDRRYESEEALEDIEYKGQLLHHNISTDASYHFNANEAHASNNHNNIWSARWKQLGAECATEQRLANTTDLHCGFSNKGEITIQPLIENEPGTCGGVRLEPNYCLMPSRGEWIWGHQSNETMLPPLPRRFGSYHHRVNSSEEKDEATNQSSPRCNTQQDIFDGNKQGSPDNFDREWVPNSCSLVPLNPFTWTDNSKCQVTIVMMGDSHIRNLFTATVHGLRGSSAFAEAHAGNDAKDTGIILTYEWRKDVDGDDNQRASDHYVVHQNTHNQTDYTSLFDECPCNEDINTRCLRIAFIWAPHFADQVKHVQLVNDLNADLVIVEPGNSYDGTTVLSNEWTSAMEMILQQPKNDHRHLAVLHFPYGIQPNGRSEAIEAWISPNNNSTTTAITEHTRKRISYWQQGKFGFGGMQSRKTWHYACGLGRIQVKNDVVQSIEMCTDEADTSYIRAITTLHFDAFGVTPR